MEARNRLWLHRLAASVVMVVALAILMICTTRTVPLCLLCPLPPLPTRHRKRAWAHRCRPSLTYVQPAALPRQNLSKRC